MRLFLCILILAAANNCKASSPQDVSTKIFVRRDCQDCSKKINSSPCCSFRWALQRVQEIKKDVDVEFLDTNVTHYESSTLAGLNNVDFYYNNSSAVTIYCKPGAGLSFVNSTNVSLEFIYFNDCGHTTDLYIHDSPVAKWQCALLFHTCRNIRVRRLILNLSNGSGIVMVNPTGQVLIDQTYFTENSLNNTSLDYPGGGGMLLYFNGTEDHDTTSQPKFNSQVLVTRCIFSSNTVWGLGLRNTKPAGGGLAVIFRRNSAYNQVQLTHSYFNGNKALHGLGSGIYIKMEGESNNNTMFMSHINLFGHNCYKETESSAFRCIGGAVSIQFLLHRTSKMAANNTVILRFALVSKNIAFAGGGISVVASRQAAETAKTNLLLFTDIKMTFNRAQVGSIMHFSSEPSTNEGYLISTIIEKLHAEQNFITNKSNVTVGQGGLYINQLPIKFRDSNVVKSCKGTAVVITGAQVTILNDSKIEFTSNHGKLGGAMALLNGATLVVQENTKLNFTDNNANEKGGAVYISNHYDTYEYPMSNQQCAISYFDSDVPPSEWKTEFSFNGNHAGLEMSAIFATSILSCPTQTTSSGNKTLPFCWTNWRYENTNNSACRYLLTSPATVQTKHLPLNKLVRTIPGFPRTLPILLIDDYNRDVTNKSVVSAFIVEGNATVDFSSQYIAGGHIIVYGQPNTTATLAIETAEPRVIYTELQLYFAQCPPGFFAKKHGERNGHTCTCDQNFRNIILCNRETFSARIIYKWCMTYDEELEEAVIGTWIYYIQLKQQHYSGYLKLPRRLNRLDKHFCKPLNRTGRLCGQCRNGTSVSVSSILFECVACNYSDFPSHLILYLIVELVPVTIFFLIVIFFNISITTGPATSFVFYSQMITLPMEVYHFQDIFKTVLGPSGKILLNILIVPYSIWNLDFFKTIIPPFCLHPSLKTMHVIALSYVRALYPLFLVIVCYLLIELYARGWKFMVYACRPFSLLLGRFRRNWQIRTSVIDAFATFLVLAYTKLCSTSFFLLVPNTLYNTTGGVYNIQLLYMDASVEYTSAEHLWLLIIGICVVVVIVIPLPIILFIYPLKHVQKVIHHFHLRNNNMVAFMDSFQGCYKDGTNGTRDLRSFSAVYFLFRIIILAITISSNDQITERILQLLCAITLILLLVIFRPYKNNIYNNLDVMTMSLMVYISAYSIAHDNSVRKLLFPSICLFLVLSIPLFYMTSYTAYHIILKCKQNKRRYTEASLHSQQYVSTSDHDTVPDRILHPENYDAINVIRDDEHVPLLNKAV